MVADVVSFRDQLQLKLRPPKALWRMQQAARGWHRLASSLFVRRGLPR